MKRNKIRVYCGTCGKSYKVVPSRLKVGRGKFCSSGCYWNSMRNLEEVECEECGIIFTAKPSAKAKYCSNLCSSISRRVHRNPIVRNSWEYQEWRLKVFKRDDFTCTKCNTRGASLNAHHILGYAQHPNARLILDNGITLCEEHHKEFHDNYGRKAFTPEQFWDYLKEK